MIIYFKSRHHTAKTKEEEVDEPSSSDTQKPSDSFDEKELAGCLLFVCLKDLQGKKQNLPKIWEKE